MKALPINLQLNEVDLQTEVWLFGSDVIDNFAQEYQEYLLTCAEIKRKGKKRIYGTN